MPEPVRLSVTATDSAPYSAKVRLNGQDITGSITEIRLKAGEVNEATISFLPDALDVDAVAELSAYVIEPEEKPGFWRRFWNWLWGFEAKELRP